LTYQAHIIIILEQQEVCKLPLKFMLFMLLLCNVAVVLQQILLRWPGQGEWDGQDM